MVTIINFAVPLDHNVAKTELAKKHKGSYRTKIIPVVVGAFGIIPEKLPDYLKELGIPDVVGGLQKTALLCTQRLVKNALSQ